MLNIFKPIHKEIYSKHSPEMVMQNIGLHIGKRRGWLKADYRSIFSGAVDAGRRKFIIRNQNHAMNRNSTMVRAEGEVQHSGAGSLVKLTLKISHFGVLLLLGIMLLLVGGAIGFILTGGAESSLDTTVWTWMALGGSIVYLSLFVFIMRAAIRREFHILESYVARQATLESTAS